jgi:argininosuccinate synthase
MEKVESSFSPEDRIGALELQNLAVGDNRALLLHYADAFARLGGGEPQKLLSDVLSRPDAT